MKFHTITTLSSIGAIALSSAALASHTPNSSRTPAEVGMAAMILGLNAESLACVDVQPNEIPIMLNRFNQEYDTYLQLVSAQENASLAKKVEAQCNAILRQDSSNLDAQLELQNAQTAVIMATNTVIQLRQSLISTALEDLADFSMVEEVFYTAGVFASLPAPYRLAVDTFEDAKDLSWALKSESQAQQSNTSTPDEAVVFLGQARTQYDVNTGIVRVEQFKSGNQSAINTWMMSN